MSLDVNAIMTDVLERYSDADKWVGAPFEKIKRLSNTKVGDVGQDFVEELCTAVGFDCEFPLVDGERRQRQSPWDIRIEGVTFELKTATEDIHGAFQFNHIRYHRTYEALLCIGVGPNDIGFDAWSKASVSTGEAGHLVSMERGGSASHKLTKRQSQLKPISEFEEHLLKLIVSIDKRREEAAS